MEEEEKEKEKEMGTDGSVVNDEEHKLASGTDTNGHDVLNSSGDNSEPETKQISKGTSRGKKEKRKGKARQPVMIDSGSEEEKEEMVADLLKPVSDDSDFDTGKKAKKGKVKSKKKAGQSTKSNPQPAVSVPTDGPDVLPVVEPNLTVEPEASVECPADDGLSGEAQVDAQKVQKESQAVDSQEMLPCAKCKAKFPSKNKLFNHLKSTGHAVYLGDQEPEVTLSKKSKMKAKK